MIELAATLRQKLAHFRSSQLGIAERFQQSSHEHDVIFAALLDWDDDGASRALHRHMVSAAKQVLSAMK